MNVGASLWRNMSFESGWAKMISTTAATVVVAARKRMARRARASRRC